MAARPAVFLAGLTLLLPLVAGGSAASGVDSPGGDTGAGTKRAGPVAADSFRSVRTYAAVAPPVRLQIPKARVDTPLERLGRAPDGTIALPSGGGLAGWYAEGPRPGQPGPAVIIGHVDWDRGPAVFYHLAELRRGDAIEVHRADGSTARFRVTSLVQVPKSEFPSSLVYAPTLEPSLRLVTCGGDFDHASRNYLDNVIVLANPA